VSYSLARATGRSWVQAPAAALLARLGNKYLLMSLMMSTLHSASVLDNNQEYNQGGLGAVLDSLANFMYIVVHTMDQIMVSIMINFHSSLNPM
jgi:hypothetical protein